MLLLPEESIHNTIQTNVPFFFFFLFACSPPQDTGIISQARRRGAWRFVLAAAGLAWPHMTATVRRTGWAAGPSLASWLRPLFPCCTGSPVLYIAGTWGPEPQWGPDLSGRTVLCVGPSVCGSSTRQPSPAQQVHRGDTESEDPSWPHAQRLPPSPCHVGYSNRRWWGPLVTGAPPTGPRRPSHSFPSTPRQTNGSDYRTHRQ
jgi:hypothetical protein